MARWIRIAHADECPPGGHLERVVEGHVVALFNVRGAYFALDGVCPHQGGPLAQGELSGCIVTCPWHGWQFDVRTGRNQLSANVIQPSFACKREGDSVYIELEEP